MNCTHCGKWVTQQYCGYCGQAANPPRINAKHIFNDILSMVNFEKGILFTVRELILRPGTSIRSVLKGNPNKLIKPLSFVVFTTVVYYLCDSYLQFTSDTVKMLNDDKSVTKAIFKWIITNYSYSLLITMFFIAPWIYVFFRKNQYNYFELIVLLSYVIGIGMLIYTVFGILDATKIVSNKRLGDIVAYGYSAYAIGNFFGARRWLNYFKGFLSFFIGVFTFAIAALVVGKLIDTFLK